VSVFFGCLALSLRGEPGQKGRRVLHRNFPNGVAFEQTQDGCVTHDGHWPPAPDRPAG
jgi:hypothetical protein